MEQSGSENGRITLGSIGKEKGLMLLRLCIGRRAVANISAVRSRFGSWTIMLGGSGERSSPSGFRNKSRIKI